MSPARNKHQWRSKVGEKNKEKVGGDLLVTWVKHICNYLSSTLGIRNVPQLSEREQSQSDKQKHERGTQEQKKNPHMKNSPTLMAQEKTLERRKTGNFIGKTLGAEQEAAKKAWLHPPPEQNSN